MVRETSYRAFVELKQDGRIGKLQEYIYDLFYIYPNSTDLDISLISEQPINMVTGRRNELMQLGVISESGKKINNDTGKEAITWHCEAPQKQEPSNGLSNTKFQHIMNNLSKANDFQKKRFMEILI